MTPRKLFLLFLTLVVTPAAYSIECRDQQPIHLDDIHLIISNEAASVNFPKDNFAARKMPPGERFDLVRFLSVKWHHPTLTRTRSGPYDDLLPERNRRWLDSEIVNAQHKPY